MELIYSCKEDSCSKNKPMEDTQTEVQRGENTEY